MSEQVPDESFPELAAFQAAERARHRRLILLVTAGSVGLLVAGGAAIAVALAREHPGAFAAGAVAAGLGVVGVVRALVSWLTDVDTRDRRPFDVEAPPLDDEDGP